MPFEPAPDGIVLVRGIVVQDDMQGQIGGCLPIEFTEEFKEFLVPMSRHTLTNYRAVQDVQGGE